LLSFQQLAFWRISLNKTKKKITKQYFFGKIPLSANCEDLLNDGFCNDRKLICVEDPSSISSYNSL